jgi:hypothetical protein
MWVAREIVRLIEKVVIVFVIALALAALWAAVSVGSFAQALRTTCLTIGCIALIMGAIGRGSNFERHMDLGATQQFWGRVPGMSSLQPKGEDPTLSPGVVFFATGVVLLAFAFFLL